MAERYAHVTRLPTAITVGVGFLCLLLVAVVPGSAQTIFENDFETGDVSEWSNFVPADTTPPTLALLEPTTGDLTDPTPLFFIGLEERLSGVDLATLTMTVDGTDRLSDCASSTTQIVCELTTPLDAGAHALDVGVADRAGNLGSLDFDFTVTPPAPDVTPPTLTFLSPAPTIEGESFDVTLAFQDDGSGVDLLSLTIAVDGVSILAQCTLSSAGAICPGLTRALGDHVASATVADREGNPAATNLDFSLAPPPPDTVSPSITIVTPDGRVDGDATPAIEVTYADEGGIDTASLAIRLDDALLGDCTIDSARATCEAPTLGAGRHTLDVEVADLAGNVIQQSGAFEVVLDLAIAIDLPIDGLLTQGDAVDIEGSIDESVRRVTVAGVEAQVAGGRFTALDVPLGEGANVLSAVAEGEDGGIGVATVTVIRDTAPPRVVVLTPGDGFVTTAPQIDIAGEIRDLDSSLIAAEDLEVTVNGVPAAVENGAFLVADFLLQPGLNVLVARCTDRAGNLGETTLTVERASSAAIRLEPLLGSRQSAPVGEALEKPLVIRLTDGLGRPLEDREVKFEVSRGDGFVSAPPTEGQRLNVMTDEQGLAQVGFTVGSRSGRGNHEVTVTSAGVPGAVIFCASGAPAPAARITPIAANQQIVARVGTVSAPIAKPLVVQVFDDFGNPVPDAPVTFEIARGGGSFDGEALRPAFTDAEGKAATSFTLGPLAGDNANRVEVSIDGTETLRASFTISGLSPVTEPVTGVSGRVLGPNDAGVPGATLRVVDASDPGAFQETVTDANGDFTLLDLEPGVIHLEVDGSTVTLPGDWVDLEYEIDLVPGRTNDIASPIRLLPLDTAGGKVVGGDQDVTLSLLGVPGAELTVFANSATYPEGAGIDGSTGTLTVTQVQNDKVPMVPPMGSDFMLAWTIQPPGVRFDPPARLAIPNDGMAPGSVVDIFSFDHDIGEFVSIGTASVTEDGSQIVTDPGFGVIKTGWHGCVPPAPPTGGACNPGSCQRCEDDRPVSNCDACSTCGCSGRACTTRGGASCQPKTPGLVQIVWGLRIDEAFVPVGDSITFRATLEEGNCEAGPYKWYVDGALIEEGDATFTHTFEDFGESTVRVELACEGCSSLPPATDDMPVTAVQIDELLVLDGGEDIADGPATPEDTNVGAALRGDGELVIEARLEPEVDASKLPPGFIRWTGGEALSDDQADQLFRQVRKDSFQAVDIIATLGDRTRSMLVYIIGATPGRFTPENGTSGASFPDNSLSWETRGFMPGLGGPGEFGGNFKSWSEMEFVIKPDAFAQAGAAQLFDIKQFDFNLERDVQTRYWLREVGVGWQEQPQSDGSNLGWAPDDVGDGPEDDDPFDGNGFIYNTDAPGLQGFGPRWNGAVFKNNFREFVKCKIRSGAFELCSDDYLYWHNFRGTIKVDGQWSSDPMFENVIAPGNVFWGALPEDSHVEITTTSLADAVVDQPYAATLSSTSGNPPIVWSLAGGALPSGLSLGTDGVIRGTPTATGTFSFDVQALDDNTPPGTDVAPLTITVGATP